MAEKNDPTLREGILRRWATEAFIVDFCLVYGTEDHKQQYITFSIARPLRLGAHVIDALRIPADPAALRQSLIDGVTVGCVNLLQYHALDASMWIPVDTIPFDLLSVILQMFEAIAISDIKKANPPSGKGTAHNTPQK